jgi:pimeloyl-ACP methyl ester carboxylesterase
VLPGGPGLSGIATADSIVKWLPESIHKRYRLLFMDVRGTGHSGALDCGYSVSLSAEPVSALYPATSLDAVTAIGQRLEACAGPNKLPPATPFMYSSQQTVRDIEAIRKSLGWETVAVYGASYGAELAQSYTQLIRQRLPCACLTSRYAPWP